MVMLYTQVAELDREHQFLEALLSPFDSDQPSSWSLDRLRALLADIRAFVRHHFRTEEALMAAYGYLDSGPHIEEHHEMEQRIDDWLLQAGEEMLDPARVRRFIYEWFVRHTAVVDMPLLEHVSRARFEETLDRV